MLKDVYIISFGRIEEYKEPILTKDHNSQRSDFTTGFLQSNLRWMSSYVQLSVCLTEDSSMARTGPRRGSVTFQQTYDLMRK